MVLGENMFFKKDKVEKEEKNLNFLNDIIQVLMKSYQLKDKVLNDDDRRLVIDIKYKLSKHPLLTLITEIVKDPHDSRWRWIEQCASVYSTTRYELLDTVTDVQVGVRCFDIKNATRHKNIRSSVDFNSDVLVEEESIFLFCFLHGLNQMYTTISVLNQQQKNLQKRNEIKDLYQCSKS